MNQRAMWIIKITVTAGVIFVLYWFTRGHFGQLKAGLRTADIMYVAAGFMIFLVSVLLATVRLGLIFSVPRLVLKVKEWLSLTFLGFFFNSFLPTGVGGDVIKAYYITKKFKQQSAEIYASVFADRVSGLMAMVTLSFMALFIPGGAVIPSPIRLIIFVLFGLMLVFLIVILNNDVARRFRLLLPILRIIRLDRFIIRGYRTLNNFHHHKRIGLLILIISFISQIVLATACAVLAIGLDIHLSLTMFIVFVPLTSMVSMVPSLGGVGPREGAFIVLFGPLIGLVDTMALAILWLAYYWAVNFIGGIVYLFNPFQRAAVSKNYDQSTTS